MLRSRIFWKLYLAFAVLVVVTVAATGFLVHQQLRTTLLGDVEQRLRDTATSLIPYATGSFSGEAAPSVQATVVDIGRRTGIRITLIGGDGVVLADSQSDPATMDNHGSRPEVVAAQSAPYGVSRRLSPTLQQSHLYVAIAAREGGRIVGSVRASIPLVAVDARLAALRNTIALGAAIGFLVAMGAGLFVAHRITAPVRAMTEVADALRDGDYGRRVDARGNDELALLGATLDRLADELTERIASLAGRRAQLGAMMSSLQEVVFAIDDNRRLIFSNAAAARLLAIDDEAAGPTSWEHAADPEIVELCAEARRAGSSTRREIVIEPPPGGEPAGQPPEQPREALVFDARATSFEAEGERGVVVVLHDVTSLRRLERLRSELVANVSHELKTPLTSIRGYVDTLLNGAVHDQDNNLRFLGKIEDQVERLDAMVSDVLALARIEATEATTVSRPVDWRGVVENVVERMRESGALDRHILTVELSDRPARVAADVESLTRIFENLLDNAVKYTPDGGAITVRVDNRDGRVVLEVEDTGMGISAADLPRIFERFFRADRARTRDSGGTGLGLAIAKHMVQNLGGELLADSTLGRGSRFVVSVPSS